MNNELKFGLYGGLAFAAWCMIEKWSGIHNNKMEIAQYSELVSGLIPLIFIYAGIKTRKREIQQNQLTFGQGVRSGMMISLLSSMLIASFLYLYVNAINTGYNKAKIDFLRSELIKAKVADNVFTQQMNGIEHMYSGSVTAHFSLMVYFASIGIIVSAVISLLLRTKMVSPSDN